MVDKTSSRQHQILNLLMENKAGLSIDEFAAALNISRTAVQQHLGKLERDGHIQPGAFNKTAGRPVRTYVLTKSGVNSFPKQYSWFSELVFADLIEEMGSDAFRRYMHKLGVSLSQKLLPRVAGMQPDERLEELLRIMNELGFQTKAIEDPAKRNKTIAACNCIYHDLAQKHQEICEFDRALISSLLETDIEHVECMANGCATCRFMVHKSQ